MINPEITDDWKHGLGLMSGTSLDGVDLAYCRFRYINDRWEFTILHAETVKYPNSILSLIRNMPKMKPEEIISADRQLGHYYGQICKAFIQERNLHPLFIASHGHTIFHNPDEGYTFQAGNGAVIAAVSGVMCISDFRSADVAKGGQGAPLVPIGDKLLFPEYDALINLGGFSNISFEKNTKRIGYDICPVNMALNHYAAKLGFEYDENGNIASKGQLNTDLLAELNSWEYYSSDPPKSLGREDFEHEIITRVQKFDFLSVPDILRTLTEHIAQQIIQNAYLFSKILFTGGGVKNNFLMSLLKEKLGDTIHVPDDMLIDYKEAMIFAFLGLLRYYGQVNVISESTGADTDSCSGAVYMP